MYKQAIEVLDREASSKDESSPEEADFLRNAADLLRSMDTGYTADISVGCALVSGALQRFKDLTGGNALALLSVPIKRITTEGEEPNFVALKDGLADALAEGRAPEAAVLSVAPRTSGVLQDPKTLMAMRQELGSVVDAVITDLIENPLQGAEE